MHGTLSNYRLARLIKYSFFKNILFCAMLFLFQVTARSMCGCVRPAVQLWLLDYASQHHVGRQPPDVVSCLCAVLLRVLRFATSTCSTLHLLSGITLLV